MSNSFLAFVATTVILCSVVIISVTAGILLTYCISGG